MPAKAGNPSRCTRVALQALQFRTDVEQRQNLPRWSRPSVDTGYAGKHLGDMLALREFLTACMAKTKGFVKVRDGIRDHWPKMSLGEMGFFHVCLNLMNRIQPPVGVITLTFKEIAAETGKSRVLVAKYMKALAEKGYLRKHENGWFVTNNGYCDEAELLAEMIENRSREEAGNTKPVIENRSSRDRKSIKPVIENRSSRDRKSIKPVIENRSSRDRKSIKPVIENRSSRDRKSITVSTQTIDTKAPQAPVDRVDSKSVDRVDSKDSKANALPVVPGGKNVAKALNEFGVVITWRNGPGPYGNLRMEPSEQSVFDYLEKTARNAGYQGETEDLRKYLNGKLLKHIETYSHLGRDGKPRGKREGPYRLTHGILSKLRSDIGELVSRNATKFKSNAERINDSLADGGAARFAKRWTDAKRRKAEGARRVHPVGDEPLSK